METRRIIGVVTVKNGLAVQSLGTKILSIGSARNFDKKA